MTINLPDIEAYNYHLPETKIAKYPLAKRDDSKLLILDEQQNLIEQAFYALPDVLHADDFLVFNNTKVIKARLGFQKTTGAMIEVFCLEPLTPSDYYQSFQSTQCVVWKCLIGNKRKWKTGVLKNDFVINDKNILLEVKIIHSIDEAFAVEFRWNNSAISFGEIIENAGNLPIPPYLKRETESSDLERYQTIYSKINGSVAAPTAGLHFTTEVLTKLEKKGIARDEITLHVGAGTFKPVKEKELINHAMHVEHFSVEKSFLNRVAQTKPQIVAVGTTSVRTLESLYHLGIKIKNSPGIRPHELTISQWEPYELPTNNIPFSSTTKILLDYLDQNKLTSLNASTQIMIVPGYKFRVVNKLITNFHQPRSTLLLLIAAFIGENWKNMYEFALGNNYRFLSYGDSTLLHPAQ